MARPGAWEARSTSAWGGQGEYHAETRPIGTKVGKVGDGAWEEQRQGKQACVSILALVGSEYLVRIGNGQALNGYP